MNNLEIIPLGGIGEFGMNCMALRYDDEMIIVDAGMGFPEETAYGVDVSVPDFEFLEPYREQFTALVLTHGHEDHLGALPYLLKKFNVPVYASHFTVGLAERKLEDHDMLGDVLIHRVSPRQKIELGPFTVDFIRASHSLVDCFSLAIKTPVGTIIHTGDYKIDDTPVIGEPMDLHALREYGKEGVLALLSDSTNATVSGRTPSERAVIPAFEEIFAEAEGRIIVSTFSSSIHRLQIVLDTALQFNRNVCVLGRSMVRNIELADELGFLDIPDGLLVNISESRSMRDEDIVYLVTGSQGETRAALWQMATNSYKGLGIEKGDTVILSSRIIPGNEKGISRLIGHIYKRGANIIEEKRRLIHVSGHASQEDIRIMTEAVNPKFVVPIHGEYRMLFRHKEFVRNHLGYAEEKVVLIENGDLLELDGEQAVITNKFEIGRTFVDATGYEEIEANTVRERKKLAYGGVVSLIVTINAETRELEEMPEIIMHGVMGFETQNGKLRDAQRTVAETVMTATREELNNLEALKEKIRIGLKRYIQRENNSKPVILPTVIEI